MVEPVHKSNRRRFEWIFERQSHVHLPLATLVGRFAAVADVRAHGVMREGQAGGGAAARGNNTRVKGE